MAKRSETFATATRQPLAENPNARLNEGDVRGPLGFFNPTRATFDLKDPRSTTAAPIVGTSDGDPSLGDLPPNAQVQWRARDNRKGRHVLLLPKGAEKLPEFPDLTASWKGVAKGIWRMCTVLAWWDVSWWIGVLFAVGSAIFIVSGLFYWLPVAYPSTTFPGEASVAGGVCAFVGATLFQIGAILLVVEACNDNQTGCFGWALEHAFTHESRGDGSSSGDSGKQARSAARRTDAKTPATTALTECEHHHAHGLHKKSQVELQHPMAGRTWEWWPTWHELTSHYFHEIGFLASFILAIGATIFYVSGILALPGVYDHLPQGVLYGIYWLTYLVGGILFVISSALYMLETQPNWYTPAPNLLGWWIGTFNMIGSVGWTLSASFGYCSAHWCEYQSDLSLLWASIAFTIGSLLLWYEALDKYPVERA